MAATHVHPSCVECSVTKVIPAICALLVVPAHAQVQRVAVGDLVREALENNAEIRAAQKRYEAARQRPVQAAAAP